MAAYGGVNFMKFKAEGSVDTIPVISHDSNLKKVEGSLLLLYTGREIKSSEICNWSVPCGGLFYFTTSGFRNMYIHGIVYVPWLDFLQKLQEIRR